MGRRGRAGRAIPHLENGARVAWFSLVVCCRASFGASSVTAGRQKKKKGLALRRRSRTVACLALLSSSSGDGGAAAGYLAGTQSSPEAQFFGMSRAERRCVGTVGRVVVRSGGSGLPSSSATACSPPAAPCTTTVTVCCRTSSYVESRRPRLIGAVSAPAQCSSTTTVAVRFRRRSRRAADVFPLVTSCHRRPCLLHRPRRPTHRRACSTS